MTEPRIEIEVAPPARSGFPVWPCPECSLPNDMLRAACRDCEAHRPCEHWDGKQRCGDVPVHMYPNGPRCDPHSPKAVRTSNETSPTRMENAA